MPGPVSGHTLGCLALVLRPLPRLPLPLAPPSVPGPLHQVTIPLRPKNHEGRVDCSWAAARWHHAVSLHCFPKVNWVKCIEAKRPRMAQYQLWPLKQKVWPKSRSVSQKAEPFHIPSPGGAPWSTVRENCIRVWMPGRGPRTTVEGGCHTWGKCYLEISNGPENRRGRQRTKKTRQIVE